MSAPPPPCRPFHNGKAVKACVESVSWHYNIAKSSTVLYYRSTFISSANEMLQYSNTPFHILSSRASPSSAVPLTSQRLSMHRGTSFLVYSDLKSRAKPILADFKCYDALGHHSCTAVKNGIDDGRHQRATDTRVSRGQATPKFVSSPATFPYWQPLLVRIPVALRARAHGLCRRQ